jgi:hypothetical protein
MADRAGTAGSRARLRRHTLNRQWRVRFSSTFITAFLQIATSTARSAPSTSRRLQPAGMRKQRSFPRGPSSHRRRTGDTISSLRCRLKLGQIGFRPIHFLRTFGLVPERHPTSGQLMVLAQDEGRQRLGFSLELQRGALRRRLLPGKRPIDLFRNQDLISAGCALQARGGVHHVADSRKIL